jgi:hypothetical protein
MKKTIQFFFSFFILLFTALKAEAITNSDSPSNPRQELTAEKLIKITPHDYEVATGKKPNFMERVGFKLLQKKLKKHASMFKADAGGDSNLLSLLSCIFGGAGLLLLLVIPIISILLGIAGFVLGLIALKKEDSKTLAIIGISCGGLVLLVLLTLIGL